MIIDFTEFGNDLKSYIDRKFDLERKKNVKLDSYIFPIKVFKMGDMKQYLNIDRKQIVRAIQKGELKAFQLERDWRTSKEELDKYLDLLFQMEDKKRARNS